MKKGMAAMAGMFLAIVLFGGLWNVLLKPLIGGGPEQSFLYPLYIGLILLAGLVVGVAVILYEEIQKLQEEVKKVNDQLQKPE